MLAKLVLAVAPVLLLVGCGGDGNSALGDRAKFRKFTLFYVGESFEGHGLRSDLSDAGNQGGRSVTFLYGDCHPQGDAGCALPLQVEDYAACARPRNGTSGPSRPLRIRGAPAAVFGENDFLELYTGNVTVVVHADGNLPLMRRAAKALRSVDGRIAPSDRLPRPALPSAKCS